MISSIHLSHLHNAEFNKFLKDIQHAIQRRAKGLDFQIELIQLVEGLEQFGAIYGTNSIGSYTLKLNDADKKRCSSFTGFGQCVRGCTHHYDQNVRKAAKIIQESIESMGKRIVYQNTQVKTSKFSLLTSSWQDKHEFIKAIETLSLTEWGKHLADLNSNFEALFLERLSAQAELPKTKLVDARVELVGLYRDIVMKIEAYHVLGNEQATDLCEFINRIIADYNKELNRRKNKSAKKIEKR